MSTTLWALRSQVKRERADPNVPPRRLSYIRALVIAEDVAIETAEMMADRERVRTGRWLLMTVLCFMVGAFTIGVVLGQKMMAW